MIALRHPPKRVACTKCEVIALDGVTCACVIRAQERARASRQTRIDRVRSFFDSTPGYVVTVLIMATSAALVTLAIIEWSKG